MSALSAITAHLQSCRLSALTFDLVLLPVGAGSARPIRFAACNQRPKGAKGAKRATRKFNSSPKTGEVPQAEGYECYNTAALRLASAWRAVLFVLLGYFRPLWAFLLVSPCVCLAVVPFRRFRAF